MSSPILSNGDAVHAEENGQEKRDPSQEKPMIPKDFIKDIVLRLYGINVIGWKELNSYDDKNYHIQIDPNINNNKYIDRLHQPGYVLKVLNSNDSKNPVMIGNMLSKGSPNIYVSRHGCVPFKNLQSICYAAFIRSNIPAAPAYGVYISQLITKFQSLWLLSGFP